MTRVRYTKTQRGARKAVYGGYMFTFARKVKLGASWRCDMRGKCLGRMVVNDSDKVVSEVAHSHAPDWGRCNAEETVQKIKTSAGSSRATTAAIIQSKVTRLSDETAMKLPKFANLKKMVRRTKRKDLPAEPKALADLENVPRRFTKTIKGT